MAGLNSVLQLGRPGGTAINGGTALGQTGGATIAQTAYGAQGTSQASGVQFVHGFFAVQVAALAWLVFLRYSLPGGGRKG